MDFAKIAEIEAAYTRASVVQDIHPDDTMWRGSGRPHYFKVGKHALMPIFAGLAQSWISDVRRVLDLPCGHGRVARHLRAAFPNAEMFYCDIDRSAVDFCVETFVGTGVYSENDPQKVDLPDNLDLIWVGSLFTHLPYAETVAWIRKLVCQLRPHGVLVATLCGPYSTHAYTQNPATAGGADWPRVHREFLEHGFGFDSYPTSPGYGVAPVRPGLIVDEITAIPDTRLLAYIERGWGFSQDVIAIGRQDRFVPF